MVCYVLIVSNKTLVDFYSIFVRHDYRTHKILIPHVMIATKSKLLLVLQNHQVCLQLVVANVIITFAATNNVYLQHPLWNVVVASLVTVKHVKASTNVRRVLKCIVLIVKTYTNVLFVVIIIV